MQSILSRYSTSDVEAKRAFAYWSDTVFRSTLDIDSPVRSHFRAQLEHREFGPAGMFRTTADVQSADRTRARIRQSDVSGYILMYLAAGELGLKQGERSVRLGPGDAVLLDMAAPYHMDCYTETRSLSVHFQKDWLRNWLPTPEQICAQPLRNVGSAAGWSTALIASLATLDATFDEPLAIPASTVADQIASLLALSAGPDMQVASTGDKLLKRIRRTIHDRCNEPGLDPAAIAVEHGISKRYLHHICASASTTFGAELMRMRLDQAKRILSDARFDALAVSEVSTRCGFLEPSHFARRFRRAFSQGPTQFRAARG